MGNHVEKAIQLVEVKDGKLAAKEEAMVQLQNIANEYGNKQVIVVSLIGKYRTGKSTLLNELIGKTDAFSKGSGKETVTKGVWGYVVDKQDKHILYLDVQGNNDPDNQETVDKLLLWCFAASSEFMYNNMGAVGQDMIKELYNFAKFQDEKFSKSTSKPHLRVLMRDPTIELDEQTPTSYVNEKLSSRADVGVDGERELLSTYYKNMQAYEFVTHPEVLERTYGIIRSDLKQDKFAETVAKLENDICTNNNRYAVGKKIFTLKEWCFLVSTHLIEIINGAGRVDLSESWLNRVYAAIEKAEEMMRFRGKETSLPEILEKERHAWRYVCSKAVTGNVTTFVGQKWKEKINTNNFKDLEDAADCHLERILDILEKGVESVCESFNHCCEDKDQHWNTPSDSGWFGEFCKNILCKKAGIKHMEITEDMERYLGDEREKNENQRRNEEIIKQAIAMMDFTDNQVSWPNILEKEKDAWKNLCESVIRKLTTYIELKCEQKISMRRFIDRKAAWRYILKKEREDCRNKCDTVTENIRQQWEEQVQAVYLDNLNCISDHCIEGIHQVEMVEELTSGDEKNLVWKSLSQCFDDQNQLWNIPSDGRWFGKLCRKTLYEKAENKQLKVKDDLRSLSELQTTYEEQIVQEVLACKNMPDDLLMLFDNWKNIRFTNIKELNAIQFVLNNSHQRYQWITKFASRAGVGTTAGAIIGTTAIKTVTTIALPYAAPVILIGSSLVTAYLVRRKVNNTHKSIQTTNLVIFKEILKNDQNSTISLLKKLSTEDESFATNLQKGLMKGVESVGSWWNSALAKAYGEDKANNEEDKANYEDDKANYEDDKANYEDDKANYEDDKANYEDDKANYEDDRANDDEEDKANDGPHLYAEFEKIDSEPNLVKYIDEVIKKIEIHSNIIKAIMVIATLQKIKIILRNKNITK